MSAWRKRKPDKPGKWLLYRVNAPLAQQLMQVTVTQSDLDRDVPRLWTADFWCPAPSHQPRKDAVDSLLGEEPGD